MEGNFNFNQPGFDLPTNYADGFAGPWKTPVHPQQTDFLANDMFQNAPHLDLTPIPAAPQQNHLPANNRSQFGSALDPFNTGCFQLDGLATQEILRAPPPAPRSGYQVPDFSQGPQPQQPVGQSQPHHFNPAGSQVNVNPLWTQDFSYEPTPAPHPGSQVPDFSQDPLPRQPVGQFQPYASNPAAPQKNANRFTTQEFSHEPNSAPHPGYQVSPFPEDPQPQQQVGQFPPYALNPAGPHGNVNGFATQGSQPPFPHPGFQAQDFDFGQHSRPRQLVGQSQPHAINQAVPHANADPVSNADPRNVFAPWTAQMLTDPAYDWIFQDRTWDSDGLSCWAAIYNFCTLARCIAMKRAHLTGPALAWAGDGFHCLAFLVEETSHAHRLRQLVVEGRMFSQEASDLLFRLIEPMLADQNEKHRVGRIRSRELAVVQQIREKQREALLRKRMLVPQAQLHLHMRSSPHAQEPAAAPVAPQHPHPSNGLAINGNNDSPVDLTGDDEAEVEGSEASPHDLTEEDPMPARTVTELSLGQSLSVKDVPQTWQAVSATQPGPARDISGASSITPPSRTTSPLSSREDALPSSQGGLTDSSETGAPPDSSSGASDQLPSNSEGIGRREQKKVPDAPLPRTLPPPGASAAYEALQQSGLKRRAWEVEGMEKLLEQRDSEERKRLRALYEAEHPGDTRMGSAAALVAPVNDEDEDDETPSAAKASRATKKVAKSPPSRKRAHDNNADISAPAKKKVATSSSSPLPKCNGNVKSSILALPGAAVPRPAPARWSLPQKTADAVARNSLIPTDKHQYGTVEKGQEMDLPNANDVRPSGPSVSSSWSKNKLPEKEDGHDSAVDVSPAKVIRSSKSSAAWPLSENQLLRRRETHDSGVDDLEHQLQAAFDQESAEEEEPEFLQRMRQAIEAPAQEPSNAYREQEAARKAGESAALAPASEVEEDFEADSEMSDDEDDEEGESEDERISAADTAETASLEEDLALARSKRDAMTNALLIKRKEQEIVKLLDKLEAKWAAVRKV